MNTGASDTEETRKSRHVSSSVSAGAVDDEIYYLSEKVPFFDVVLSKSHVHPASTVGLPVTVLSMLPLTNIPVVLRHGGKNWTVNYHGNNNRPRFSTNWKSFVIDNHLKFGDACVFELIDPSHTKPVFKVHILRNDLPPELEALVETRGKSSDTPIVLD